ncbi:helix-turn-helix domain-containing protein [Sinosporangium siamense]
MSELPEVLPLEAWRYAHGWTRGEVAARLDAAYVADNLAPPGVSASTLCKWEHGERRPSSERVDYLCQVYRTRPDRLGFGVDHSPGDTDHLTSIGLVDAWPHASQQSEQDLIHRVQSAHRRINLFGLTRNFYARDELLPLLEEVASSVPVRIYVMDPFCASRKDRYRIEPAEASMEDPERYIREVLRPIGEAVNRVPNGGLQVFTYNFPCSFAIEEIDDVCRVMLYGHGVRGTQGPLLIFSDGPGHRYFSDQVRWLERLARSTPEPEPWRAKGLVVEPLALP